jgi:hypothetical protein
MSSYEFDRKINYIRKKKMQHHHEEDFSIASENRVENQSFY